MLNFIKNKQILFLKGCTILYSHKQCVGVRCSASDIDRFLSFSYNISIFPLLFFFKLHLRMSLPHTLYFNRLYSAFFLYLKWLMVNSLQETISIFFPSNTLRILLHRGDGEKPQGTFSCLCCSECCRVVELYPVLCCRDPFFQGFYHCIL